MSLVRRRYTLVIDLNVDAERFAPNEVPDEIVAVEKFIEDELDGSVVDVVVGNALDPPS